MAFVTQNCRGAHCASATYPYDYYERKYLRSRTANGRPYKIRKHLSD